ncbi:MAG: hypothetical protein RLY93_03990 [Sumerlaeia bacterium]
MPNRTLDALFVNTAALSFLMALASWLLIGPEWSARYCAAALFGWFNWFFLAKILLAVTSRQGLFALLWVAAKLGLIVLLLLYAIEAGLEITAFLAGFLTFFVAALIVTVRDVYSSGTPLRTRIQGKLDSARADLLGRPSDG